MLSPCVAQKQFSPEEEKASQSCGAHVDAFNCTDRRSGLKKFGTISRAYSQVFQTEKVGYTGDFPSHTDLTFGSHYLLLSRGNGARQGCLPGAMLLPKLEPMKVLLQIQIPNVDPFSSWLHGYFQIPELASIMFSFRTLFYIPTMYLFSEESSNFHLHSI